VLTVYVGETSVNGPVFAFPASPVIYCAVRVPAVVGAVVNLIDAVLGEEFAETSPTGNKMGEEFIVVVKYLANFPVITPVVAPALSVNVPIPVVASPSVSVFVPVEIFPLVVLNVNVL
jgi:hypothetical protein